jgi:hypothetical protein
MAQVRGPGQPVTWLWLKSCTATLRSIVRARLLGDSQQRPRTRGGKGSCALCCGSHRTKAGPAPACVAAPLGPATAAPPCALCLWDCWRWQCIGPGSAAANRQHGVTPQGLTWLARSCKLQPVAAARTVCCLPVAQKRQERLCALTNHVWFSQLQRRASQASVCSQAARPGGWVCESCRMYTGTKQQAQLAAELTVSGASGPVSCGTVGVPVTVCRTS